eukprot:1335214-Rhodomonas_salina.1
MEGGARSSGEENAASLRVKDAEALVSFVEANAQENPRCPASGKLPVLDSVLAQVRHSVAAEGMEKRNRR